MRMITQASDNKGNQIYNASQRAEKKISMKNR